GGGEVSQNRGSIWPGKHTIKAHDAHAVPRTVADVSVAFPLALSRDGRGNYPLCSAPREGRDVRGGGPTIQNRKTPNYRPGTVYHKRHRRLFGTTEAGMLNRSHEAASLHMLVIRESHRRIHRHSTNPLGFHHV